MKWPTVLLTLLLFSCCCCADPFTYTSSTGLAYTVNPDSVQVTFNGKQIVDGEWTVTGAAATFAGDPDADLGAPLKRSMAKVRTNAVRQVQTYAAFKVTHTWVMSGEDVVITSVVQNINGAPLTVLKFSGLTLHFAHQPKGFLPSWHWTYLQAVGLPIMHPSTWVPNGAMYAADDWGFSAFTASHFDKPKFMDAVFEANGIIPADSHFEFYVPELIEAGQTKTFDLHLRFSKDGTWKHLLTPYKAAFTTPQQYLPETRPSAYSAAADTSWVRDDNPYGFGDNLGDSPWRRFDKPDGALGFIAQLADPLKQAGAWGCILWIPQGVNPRGAQYRPDFDVFPPEVAPNLPVLTKGFADHGLRLGLCARPGEAVDRTDWLKDDTFRLDARSKSQMDRLWSRFDHTIKLGFTSYYLDTFGSDYNDYLIMKVLRKRMGPTILCYGEYASDIILPYMGRYLELRAGNIVWLTDEQLEIQRWLVPNAAFVCKPLDGSTVKDARARNLPPMVDDWMINLLTAN